MGAPTGRRRVIGWLAYQPEQRAVDDSLVVDLQFDVEGTTLPVDHGLALCGALTRALPWFADEELGGPHPVPGAPDGQGKLILGRRARLTIRVASARAEAWRVLTGQTLDIEGHRLVVGAAKTKPLSRHTPLFAHCVITESEDEVAFANDVIRALDELRIDSRFICGKRQAIRTEDGERSGFSLMLHGLPIEHSFLVQQRGLGKYRKIGCGIFIPHKSIAALT